VGSTAVLEEPGVVAGVDDIAVMGQTIEHGGRHLGVTKHLGPVRERYIGSVPQQCVFIELPDQVEQQLRARLTESTADSRVY